MSDLGLWFDPTEIIIGGKSRAGSSGELIAVTNPSNGKEIAKIARGTSADVDAAVKAAEAALKGPWGKLSATERGRLLVKLADKVRERAEDMARLECIDIGKPIGQCRNDVTALLRYLEFYAGAADKLHGETLPFLTGYTALTIREPHGVTGHIVPWNYPMQIVGRSVGAALAAGNAAVLKPAEDASLSSLAFAHLAIEAGFPEGVLNVVTGYGAEVGAALSQHSGVHHVSFTGSVGVGRQIQIAAAQNAVPVTLELGGKSPHIVFDDVDLEAALPTLVGACMQAAGQTCSAPSRVLVQRGIYEQVIEGMSKLYRELTAGDAIDNPRIGPLASHKQQASVNKILELGADLTIAAQGDISMAPKEGAFVCPTLFRDVPPDHPLFQTEIFGPVQVVTPFDTEEEAIELANCTDYGLVAGVWTRDGARQFRMARAVEAGQVFINNYGAAGGIELPFGGSKLSGHGREKGFEALYGFTRLKTICVHHG